MKKYLSIFHIFIALSGLLYAQVGINTTAPTHTLYIDAAGNNNNAAPSTDQQKLDDVVVTEEGAMGLGIIDPTHKLEINGSIKIVDGTEDDGKVLASDADGVASWVDTSIFSETNKFSEWTLRRMAVDGTTFPFTNSEDGNDLTGTSVLNALNEIGLTTVSNYGIQIPVGKYLVLLNGDIDAVREYCQLQVINDADDSIIFRSYYSEWLGGATFVLELSDPTVLKLKLFDWPTTGVAYYQHPTPTRNIHYWYTLTFIQLSTTN